MKSVTRLSQQDCVAGFTGPTIERLRSVVKATCHKNPHLTSRLEKAAFLVLLRSIIPFGDNNYRVGSEDGLKEYTVIHGHCDCSDYVRHGPGHPCKHKLAIQLHQSIF